MTQNEKQLPRNRSVIGVAAASFAAGIVALLTSIILTRAMSPEDFGAYRYIVAVIGFAAVAANLGLPYSAARLLTQQDSRSQSRTIAASLQLLLSALAVTGVVLAIVAIATRTILDVSPLLLVASVLFWTTALQRHFNYTLRGIGGAREIAFQTIAPPAFILLLSATIAYVFPTFSLSAILIVMGVAYFVTHVTTATRVRVWGARKLQYERSELLKTQKSVGFPIYKGALISVGAAELILVLGGAYVGKLDFGSFALAMSLAGPVATMPSAIAMVQFRKFGIQGRLESETLLKTTLYSSVIGVVAVIVGWSIFPMIFPSDFENARMMFPFLALGLLLLGLGDYLNQFLQAQGVGNRIKRATYIVGVVNILVGIGTIPVLGVWGLVATKVIGSAFYLTAMLLLTNRWNREAG